MGRHGDPEGINRQLHRGALKRLKLRAGREVRGAGGTQWVSSLAA